LAKSNISIGPLNVPQRGSGAQTDAPRAASDYALMLAVLTLPVTAMLLGFVAGLPVSSLVLIVFLARLLGKLRRSGEASNPLESAGLVPAAPGAISAL
jgi:hypothetical protein